MRSPEAAGRGPVRLVLVVALVGCLGALAGLGARATHGARTTADEPQYLLSATSLAEDADLDIADELADERWRAYHTAALPQQTRPLTDADGRARRISPHDPLLPLLLAPGQALGGWVGAKGTLVLVAGLLAGLLQWTAVARLGVRPAVAASVLAPLVASVPLAPYGTQVYPELPAALAVLAVVAVVTGPSLGRGLCWAAAAGIVALPWLAVKHAPVAAVLAGLVLWRLRREGRARAALGLATGLALAGLVYLGLHVAVWTGPTVYASADHFTASGELGVVGFAPDYLGRSRRLVGLLVDRDFGLAAWQPAWLLAVPAAAWVLRRRPAQRAALLAPLAAGWAMATWIALTMQGWWAPGRQVVAVLPLAALALAAWADEVRLVRRAAALAGALGVLSWLWLAIEATTGPLTLVVDFTATANPWYRAWSAALPDYLHATGAALWVRHALWAALLLAAAAGAWSTEPGNDQGALRRSRG